jgi:hypothetical protein
LVFDGADSGKQARITAPAQWDNYVIEVDVCFDKVLDNNRWASIMFRVPANGKNPYNEMSIRKSGVWEISYRDEDNKWSIPFKEVGIRALSILTNHIQLKFVCSTIT